MAVPFLAGTQYCISALDGVCHLWGQGSVGGFAVVEYSTAEHAEEVQQAADGMTIKGSKVQVSFCAPGCFVWKAFSTFPAHLRMSPVSRGNSRGSLVWSQAKERKNWSGRWRGRELSVASSRRRVIFMSFPEGEEISRVK